jgi:hypothetical protein
VTVCVVLGYIWEDIARAASSLLREITSE